MASNDYLDVEQLPESNDPSWLLAVQSDGSARKMRTSNFATYAQGQLASTSLQGVSQGPGIGIDNTDPKNPVIRFTGGLGGGLFGPASATDGNIPVFDGDTGELVADSGFSIENFVQSLVEGTNIAIDDADPAHPIISTTGGSGTVTSVGLAAPADFTVTNSPVTGSGVLTLTRAAGYEAYTSTEKTKLSGISTGADVTAAALFGLPTKSTPVDADYFGIIDSAASNVLKALSWANVKATLKTYFDTLYGALATANQWTKPQRASATAIPSGTTLTADLADNNDFTVASYAHNGTLANPTNQSTQVNQKGSISITQDGTGGRTLSFGSNWKAIGSASAPSINTTAGVTSVIDYHVLSSTVIRYSLRAVGAA